MPAFSDAKEDTERKLIIKLLMMLAENPETTQRNLATEMGISLGMMVSYMKSCVRKGLVRSKQVSPRRWAYFVTPKGFAEKSRMISGYLHSAMTFFRDTRFQLECLFRNCEKRGFRSIAMVGTGDVVEIAQLVACRFSLAIKNFKGISSDYIEEFKNFDGIFIADIESTQVMFDMLRNFFSEDKLLSIDTLFIIRRNIDKVY